MISTVVRVFFPLFAVILGLIPSTLYDPPKSCQDSAQKQSRPWTLPDLSLHAYPSKKKCWEKIVINNLTQSSPLSTLDLLFEVLQIHLECFPSFLYLHQSSALSSWNHDFFLMSFNQPLCPYFGPSLMQYS